MEEVKRSTGKADIEKAKLKNAFSHRELEDGDVIIPKQSGNVGTDRIVLHITIGVLLGILCFYILVLPTIRRGYSDDLNKAVAENSAELSEVNARYTELNSNYDSLNMHMRLKMPHLRICMRSLTALPRITMPEI